MNTTKAELRTHHEFLELTQATNIKQLISIGVKLRATHLWVMPSCNLEITEVEADVDGEGKHNSSTHWYSVSANKDTYMLSGERAHENMVISATGYQRQPKSTLKVHIIFFAQSKWSILPPDTERLAAMAEEIESTLGVPLSGAPATVGIRYLKNKNQRHGEAYFQKPEYFVDRSVNPPRQVPIKWETFKKLGRTNNPIAWFPAPTDEQLKGMKYVHCFDRNGSHPYAASKARIGIGNPTRVGAVPFNHLWPGYWNVRIAGVEELCKGLPPLLPKPDAQGIYVAIPTSVVKMARDQGCTIEVERAMIWPEKEQRAPVFERWARDLWNLRQTYEPGTLENQAIKLVMNSTVGFSRHGDEYSQDFRSDWYDAIVAEEKAVVWYRAHKIAKEHNILPAGAYHDALYYYSASDDPASIPSILNPEAFGGYKCDWNPPLKITPKVRAVLNQQLAASAKIGELKKLLKRGNA